MITYYPSYYKDFKCIASKCTTSCCSAGWEILIDSETAKKYKKVHGNFGKQLHKNVDFHKPAKFKLDSHGKCPFLNEKNLCDIYINLGEDCLCQICTDHPRFYECYNTMIECGIGMYCEEACRIIFSQNAEFSMYTEETNEVINKDYSEEIFKFIYKERAKIFEYLHNNSLNLHQRIADILWFANVLQQDIDSDILDDEEIFAVKSSTNTSMNSIFSYFFELEPNDEKWFEYLKKAFEIYNKNLEKFIDFEKQNPAVNKYLENIATYFIFRYFLRGVFEYDVLSSVKFMAISTAILEVLFFSKWIEQGSLSLMDCVMIAKKYSEEIECSDDNIMNIHIACYELDTFSVENIIGFLI